MSKNAWHKRYHGAALGGYMGLSLEERGAYTTVLDLMYDTEWAPGIRDNDRWIAGHLDVSVRKWRTLRACLFDKGKLDIFEGFISNKKYREVRENALEISRKRSESGASGGEKSGEVRRKVAENGQSDEAIASGLPLYARASESRDKREELEEGSSEPSTRTTKPKRRKASPEAPLPPDFEPALTDHARQLWNALDSPERELRKFKDHALSKGRTAKDWQAAFRTWLEKANEFQEARANGRGTNTGNGHGGGRDERSGFARAIDRDLGRN